MDEQILQAFEKVRADPESFQQKPTTPEAVKYVTDQTVKDLGLTLYRQTIENIKNSESLRSEITKSIQAKAELLVVLDKAIKCISLMTGDRAFYQTNSKGLRVLKGNK